MIVVDASAVLAILLKEVDAAAFAERLAVAGTSMISAINYWEAMVWANTIHGDGGQSMVDDLLAELKVAVAPADADVARRAARAFARFRGRPGGRLNLGDCFAYALAEREGDGLLYKGNDFPKTDVRSALA